MYVCMYVCMYVYIVYDYSLLVYVCMYACFHGLYVCMYVCMYVQQEGLLGLVVELFFKYEWNSMLHQSTTRIITWIMDAGPSRYVCMHVWMDACMDGCMHACM